MILKSFDLARKDVEQFSMRIIVLCSCKLQMLRRLLARLFFVKAFCWKFRVLAFSCSFVLFVELSWNGCFDLWSEND